MTRVAWGFYVDGKIRRAWLLGLPFFLWFSGAMGEIEHVSIDQSLGLRAQFARAHIIERRDHHVLTDRDWICEMYGMRSRFQVERNVRLYRFKSDALVKTGGPQKIKNLGGPLVEDYSFESGGLVGHRGPMQDRVRWLKKGQEIITEIALKAGEQSSAQGPDANVIAYCKCKTLL